MCAFEYDFNNWDSKENFLEIDFEILNAKHGKEGYMTEIHYKKTPKICWWHKSQVKESYQKWDESPICVLAGQQVLYIIHFGARKSIIRDCAQGHWYTTEN